MKLDLKKQKDRLQAKKAELERSMAGLNLAYPVPTPSIELHDAPRESEDVATDFLEMNKEQSIMANQQALLTLVENALQRMANGTYGLCLHCRQAIPPARLNALPWAEYCVRCEAEVEQVYRNREEVYGEQQTFY